MPYGRRGFTLLSRQEEHFVQDLPASASLNQPIAIGDAVSIVNGVVVPATAGQDPGLAGFGVVLEVLQTNGRPLTHAAVKLIASGGGGRVRVYTDPNAEYVVRCDTSAGQTIIGKNVVLNTSAANAITGISAQSVAQPASASVNDLFKVIDWYGEERNGGVDPTGSGLGVVVRWNRHINRAATANA